ncbi:hypothetical protein FD755_025532, partial [Muntiacus reevesi]
KSQQVCSRLCRYFIAGWKENHATFMSELKNLRASGLTTLGQALRSSFDLLNLNRLISGIDNYGQGRNPFFLEPSILITITDGNKLTSTSGVQEEGVYQLMNLPSHRCVKSQEVLADIYYF